VLGVGAHTLAAGRFVEEGRLMIRMALGFLAIMVPLQIVLGDMHGLNTLAYQPAKLAAMEGLWDGGEGVPASLFAIPDQAAERNDLEIAIPKLGSLYLTHDWNGAVKGLKDFPAADRPSVIVVYFAFRIMVGCGLLMAALVALGWILSWRGRLFQAGWYLRLVQWTIPVGFVAVLAGWTTTEAGRQPWTVYGLLRTEDSVTPSLTGADVLLSLLLYMAVYLLVYPTGFLFMRRIVRHGPLAHDPEADVAVEGGRPESPVLALPHGDAS
jgi:cytochrome d ubiquinol oxidase subunit I